MIGVGAAIGGVVRADPWPYSWRKAAIGCVRLARQAGRASSLTREHADIELDGSGRWPGISTLCDLPDCTNSKELELKSSQWAPDGKGVAYINEQDHGNLWEQPLDGRPPRALTHFADAQILEFAWSPDYKRLVLSRGRLSDDIVLLKGLR